MDVKQVVAIISQSLDVVQQIGNTPGVSLIPYVGTITSVAGALHQLIDAEQEFEPLALKLADTFKPGALPPTEEAMAELMADTDAELDKLRTMPPKEEGEED